MNKTKVLTWLVTGLLIMNVATIGTIFYHRYLDNKQYDNIGYNTGSGGNMLNGKFFRQTLGFDNAQMDVFRKVNQVFRPGAKRLTFQIDSLKNDMFLELNKAEPDTLQLNAEAKQIGELHGQLKYETYRFYLAIKKICSRQQQTTLEKLFQPLFKNDSLATPPDHQQQRKRMNN